MPSKTSAACPRRTCDCWADMLLSAPGTRSALVKPGRWPSLFPVPAFHCAVMLSGSRAEAELKAGVLSVAEMSSSLVVYTMPGW